MTFKNGFIICLMLLILGCSGSEKTPERQPTPVAPADTVTIDITQPLNVQERDLFVVEATAVINGLSATSYRWEQLAGPIIDIGDPTAKRLEIFAPNIETNDRIVMALTVKANNRDYLEQIAINIDAYENINRNLITDPGLKACVSNPNIDTGTTSIRCENNVIYSLSGISQFESLQKLEILRRFRSEPISSTELDEALAYSELNQLDNLTELVLTVPSWPLSNDIELRGLNKLESVHLISQDPYYDWRNSNFTNVTNIKSLRLEKPCDLEFIPALDTRILAPLSSLERLHVECVGIGSYNGEYISQLSQLKELSIERSRLGGVNFLDPMSDLETLSLWELIYRSSIDGIQNVSGLETLNVTIQSDDDWEKVLHQKHVKNLSVYIIGGSTINVSDLTDFTDLESLRVEAAFESELADFEETENDHHWPNLKTIEFVKMNMKSVDFVYSTPNLKTFHLEAREYPETLILDKTVDLEALKSVDLEKLSLIGVRYFDFIESIGDFQSLTELSLRAYRINNDDYLQDGAPIGNLNGLKKLSISDDIFSSLDFIASLELLEEYSSFRVPGYRNSNFATQEYPSFENLAYLTSFTGYKMKNHDILATAKNLKELKLFYVRGIATWIGDLTELEHLSVVPQNVYTSFAFSSELSHLKKLRTLSFAPTIQKEIDSLGALENLEYLELLFRDKMDLTKLSGDGNLQTLNVRLWQGMYNELGPAYCDDLNLLNDSINAQIFFPVNCEQ